MGKTPDDIFSHPNPQTVETTQMAFRRFLLTTFSLIVLAVGWLTWKTHTHNQAQLETNRWINHTHKVLYHSQRLLNYLVDSETAYRGFVITGNKEFLEPLEEAQVIIRQEFHMLKLLTADNIGQLPRIQILEKLVRRKLNWADSVIDTRFRDKALATQMVSNLNGKQIMDAARRQVSNLQQTENKLLQQRTQENSAQIATFIQLFTLTQVGLATVIFILLVVIFLNLNARRKAESELREASFEIKDLYDNAPTGYLSVDTSIVISNINMTLLRWLGYTREEVIGKFRYEDLLSKESRKAFLASFEQDFDAFEKKGAVHNLEFDFQRKDGSTIPVMVSSVAILDEKGKFVKSRSSVTDYSEQKRAFERIVQLNAELDAFTYSVSHDLRTPLRSVVGYAQILREDYGAKLDEEGVRLIGIITRGATRMGQLIDDLLEFSRVSKKEIQKVKVDTNGLVQSVISDFLAHGPDNSMQLHVLDLLPCHADVNLLRQVWINLLSNAIKYSSKSSKPTISITSFVQNTQICYCVEDNGAGFDMRHADKLFGVFQRLHKATEFEGNGVGLALVKRIVTRHGGKVWAESAVGEGAKFYFSIP